MIKTSDTGAQKTVTTFNESEAPLSCYNMYEQSLIAHDTDFFCYREPIKDITKTEMKICVPFPLFPPLLSITHTLSHSGRPGLLKTFENITH